MKRASLLFIAIGLMNGCTTGAGGGPEHGGAAATAGAGGAGGGGAGGASGAGGQAGTAAGSSGAGGGGAGGAGSGGAGGAGAGGTGGMMQPPIDGGSDAASDASMPGRPLAERVCPAGPFGDPLPPAGQRTATIVPGMQNGFVFIEGPVWIAEQGVLLFSDMDFGAPDMGMGPPARIRRLTLPSTFDVFVENGNSNGLALDLEGEVLACTHDQQTLSRYDSTTAARTTLSTLRYNGLRFNSPNDLTVRSDGTVYFTDPDWQLGSRASETNATNVYRVTPSGTVELVTSELDKPNGIALSPDEATLYVGSAGSDILAFAVNPDGSVGNSRVFASAGGGTDGFAIDCAGNLYATGGSNVQVWNAAGDKLGDIAVPQGPSNAAFGGADRRTLFITAQSALYSIQLQVPGLPY
jgi:gluconolactonase